jgi:hypothetical protein
LVIFKQVQKFHSDQVLGNSIASINSKNSIWTQFLQVKLKRLTYSLKIIKKQQLNSDIRQKMSGDVKLNLIIDSYKSHLSLITTIKTGLSSRILKKSSNVTKKFFAFFMIFKKISRLEVLP